MKKQTRDLRNDEAKGEFKLEKNRLAIYPLREGYIGGFYGGDIGDAGYIVAKSFEDAKIFVRKNEMLSGLGWHCIVYGNRRINIPKNLTLLFREEEYFHDLGEMLKILSVNFEKKESGGRPK